jgi:DNA-binding transcriptional regulator YiaG
MNEDLSTGERLRRWRSAAALVQDEAARVFGATTAAYRKWEADEVEPTGEDLVYRRRVEKVLRRFERKEQAALDAQEVS